MSRIYSHQRACNRCLDDIKSFLVDTKVEVDTLTKFVGSDASGKRDSEYNSTERQAKLIILQIDQIGEEVDNLINVYHDQVLGKYEDKQSEECRAHAKVILDLEDRIAELKKISKVMERVKLICDSGKRENKEKRENTQPTIMQAPAATNVIIKQPSPIPNFSGKYEDWHLFWSIYSSNIHKDTSLSSCEKFHRLMVGLQGEAKNIIKGLVVTEENYQIAIDLLRTKYENKTEISRNLHKKLLALVPKSTKIADQKEYLGELKTTIAQLSENDSEPDPTLITVHLLQKFSRPIRNNMAAKIVENPDLEKDLASLFRSLAIAVETQERKEEISPPNEFHSKEKDTSHTNMTNKQTGLISSTPARQNDKPCVYCRDYYHRSWECKRVNDIDDRIAHLQREKRCTQCTGRGHDISACYAPSCWLCNDAHHSSICPSQTQQTDADQMNANTCRNANRDNHQGQNRNRCWPRVQQGQGSMSQSSDYQQQSKEYAQSEQSDDNSSESEQENTEASAYLANTNSNSNVLPIACIKVQHHANVVEPLDIFVLTDTGASDSFITEEAAKILGLRKLISKQVLIEKLGEKPRKVVYPIYRLKMIDPNGKKIRIKVKGSKTLISEKVIPLLSKEDRKAIHEQKISLSLKMKDRIIKPQIVIGQDYMGKFLDSSKPITMLPSGLMLLPSKFGHMLMGRQLNVTKPAFEKVTASTVFIKQMKQQRTSHDKGAKVQHQQSKGIHAPERDRNAISYQKHPPNGRRDKSPLNRNIVKTPAVVKSTQAAKNFSSTHRIGEPATGKTPEKNFDGLKNPLNKSSDTRRSYRAINSQLGDEKSNKKPIGNQNRCNSIPKFCNSNKTSIGQPKKATSKNRSMKWSSSNEYPAILADIQRFLVELNTTKSGNSKPYKEDTMVTKAVPTSSNDSSATNRPTKNKHVRSSLQHRVIWKSPADPRQ